MVQHDLHKEESKNSFSSEHWSPMASGAIPTAKAGLFTYTRLSSPAVKDPGYFFQRTDKAVGLDRCHMANMHSQKQKTICVACNKKRYTYTRC